MQTGSSAAAVFRPRPRPRADRVLVCLSYCGGGTAPFRQWAEAVPEDVDLALICYPGREARFGVPFARDWVALRDDAVEAVRGLADRPYTLFGHSMGSWVAFEVVAQLERLGVAPPTELVVSGGTAPHKRELRDDVPRSSDSDDALVAWMREFGQMSPVVANEPELRRMAVELLRADLGVSESYRYARGTRARVPLRLLYGTRDAEPFPVVEQDWKSLADGGFEAHQLPGGHFYETDVWAGLPRRFLGSAVEAGRSGALS
ncbi:thioesterase II family protein [Streptomyces sp. NPDC059605]|uniref:thioesterase II family protein n=1 Tax=unclassified Streptomyces TaxID=2593676 RepID=UPI0036895262